VVVVGVKTLHLTQKGGRGLWWVVVGVKPVPSCVLSEGGVVVTWKGCGGCESLTLRGREGWWW
jgi:hypothetical protein